jgi:hypothetical protein
MLMDADTSQVGRTPWRAQPGAARKVLGRTASRVKKMKLLELRWRYPLSSTVVGLTLAAPGCMHAPNPEEPPSASLRGPVVASASSAPAPAASQATGVPWTDGAQTTQVPERQGKPLSLAHGARCKTFRNLPSLTYTVNTLVEDACLKIPNDTVIEVRNGATLAIVATSGLSIGKNVTFNAKGTRGRRGDRSAFASVRYAAASDAEIQAICVEQGNRCACPSVESSQGMLRGQPGAIGLSGGNIRVIAQELLSPSQLAGLAIDVSGGTGGPPGDSGTQECWRGTLRCSSTVCSAGAVSGTSGPPGRFFVAFSGTVHPTAMGHVKTALGPPSATNAVLVGPSVTVTDELATLDAEAIQKGWQRRAGQEAY